MRSSAGEHQPPCSNLLGGIIQEDMISASRGGGFFFLRFLITRFIQWLF
jgi:hypothetical protein